MRAKPATVADLMSRETRTLGRNDKLNVADDLMKLQRIRHLPVVENGALGGKLLGAGGGGFMLFYCPKEKQQKLKEKLSGIRPFDFNFEQDGSKLIHYSHD